MLQQRDEPGKLTPAAELYDIVAVARLGSAGGRFVGGGRSEPLHQVVRHAQVGTVGDIGYGGVAHGVFRFTDRAGTNPAALPAPFDR